MDGKEEHNLEANDNDTPADDQAEEEYKVVDAMEFRFGPMMKLFDEKFPGQVYEFMFRGDNGLSIIEVGDHTATVGVRVVKEEGYLLYVTCGLGNLCNLIQVAQGIHPHDMVITQEAIVKIPAAGDEEGPAAFPQWPVILLFNLIRAFLSGAPLLPRFATMPTGGPVIPPNHPGSDQCNHQCLIVMPNDTWPVVPDVNGTVNFVYLTSITETEREYVRDEGGDKLWQLMKEKLGEDCYTTRVSRGSVV